MVEIRRANCFPSNKSLAAAFAIILPDAIRSPCINRKIKTKINEADRDKISTVKIYKKRLDKITVLRPNRSEMGPYKICPKALPAKIAVIVNSIWLIVTVKPLAIAGSMGSKISMEIGPIMARRPKIKQSRR